ncbi:hypothetical protein [Rubellimicrobium rubrum]|uniref:hypothetical protein n=1 Tax=Rubellimicrobium rubrum TaxID=2585369 RepID=UPI001FEBD002|nr:hypothetical protein [Rubellimicrobium rubrum]
MRDRVTIIGAADYELPGAGPGEYYSVVIAHAASPALGARFALNDAASNSGCDLGQE